MKHQKEDETCQLQCKYCTLGWQDSVQGTLKQYQPVATEITIQNGLLMREPSYHNTVGPQNGDIAENKCWTSCSCEILPTCQSVWWPSLENQLHELTAKARFRRRSSHVMN